MAELLDSQPRHGVVVKATATMLHPGCGAHLAGEPPLGSLCREAPWPGPDRASSGGDGRLGKFSPAVNHPTRHTRARLRRKGRSRKISGTVTTTDCLRDPTVARLVATTAGRGRVTGRLGIGELGTDRLAAGGIGNGPHPSVANARSSISAVTGFTLSLRRM